MAYSNGGTISQTLTNTNFQPNTTYTLSVAVGHRADGYVANYTVALQAGSTVVASSSGSNGTITAGTFATVTVTYTTGSTPPSGNITVALSAAGAQVDFDNVQLGINGSSTNSAVYFYEDDMLGTSRTIVADGQTAPCYDADFYPFGGERVITNTCPQNYKFEGKERDTETNNDDFGARYYTSRLGRWLSADWSSVPAPVPYANLTNPQTLNLYSMVSDNPESFADLNGHCLIDFDCIGTWSWNFGPLNSGTTASNNNTTAPATTPANNPVNTGTDPNQQSQQTAITQQQHAANKHTKSKTDDKPAKFVIEPKKTENKGYYSVYHYKLENKEGAVLTADGYSVEEHISGKTSVSQQTSEGEFIDVTNGEIPDNVGKAAPPPGNYSQDSIVYQTFTVRYKNHNYDLATKFKHEVKVSNGVVTTKVTDVTGEK